MKTMMVAAGAMVLGTAGAAAAATPAVEVPIRTFIDSFNKGDAAAAAATHEAGATIIDEVPPFLWTGAKSFATWAADLAANDKAAGITAEQVAIKPATRTVMAGDRAYVIVPAVYSFTRNGVAMREPAQFAFAMHKTGKTWKIAGWTWTGPDPKPAK